MLNQLAKSYTILTDKLRQNPLDLKVICYMHVRIMLSTTRLMGGWIDYFVEAPMTVEQVEETNKIYSTYAFTPRVSTKICS